MDRPTQSSRRLVARTEPALRPVRTRARGLLHELGHETLNRLGDRWTIYVVRALRDGPRRFNQLKRKIGDVSSRMLTLTLKKLERDGIVARTADAATQPRVDYRLTPLGMTFLEPLLLLLIWADEHGPEVEAARELYDAARRTEPAPAARTGT